MDTFTSEETISDSIEESLEKAIRLIESDGAEQKPVQRPDISTARILLGFLLWILIIGAYVFLCWRIGERFRFSLFVTYVISIGGSLLIVAAKAKAFVRNAVLLYQKHAPKRTRRACLFVPSCSEYMLLAVEKYGVIVGVYKGIGRILRCRHPNGGVDYP